MWRPEARTWSFGAEQLHGRNWIIEEVAEAEHGTDQNTWRSATILKTQNKDKITCTSYHNCNLSHWGFFLLNKHTYYFSMSLFIHMNWLWVHFRLHGYCNTVVNWGENTAFLKKEGSREDYARRSSLPRQSQTHNDLVITCPSTCQSIVVMSLNSNKQKLSFYWKSQIWLNSQMCLMQVADIAKVWWSTH